MKNYVAINNRASILAAEIRPTTNLIQAQQITRMVLENRDVVVAGYGPQPERDIALATLSQFLNGSFGEIVEAEQRFALHCILAICEQALDNEIKHAAVKIYVDFFEKQYAKPSVDESDQITAIKPLLSWLDNFSNFSFAAKATAIYLFTVLVREKHDYREFEDRLQKVLERLKPKQLDMMTTFVAIAAEQNDTDGEELLGPLIKRIVFLESGLKVLVNLSKIKGIYSCLAQLNILIIFLQNLELPRQKENNKKLVLELISDTVDKIPNPDEQKNRIRLCHYLNELLAKCRQYYDPHVNKRQSTSIETAVTRKNIFTFPFSNKPYKIQILNKLYEKKYNLEKNLEEENMLLPAEPSLFSRVSNVGSILGGLVLAFRNAASIDERIDVAIQIYLQLQENLEDKIELETTCINYLLMTMGVGVSRKDLTPQYLTRQRLLYGIGHRYQGCQMPFMEDVNKWLKTLSNEALQENQVELKAQYQVKIVSAIEKAIEDGMILTLSDAKIEEECLLLLFGQLLRPLTDSEVEKPNEIVIKNLLIKGKEIKLAELDFALIAQLKNYVKTHEANNSKEPYVNFLKKLFQDKVIIIEVSENSDVIDSIYKKFIEQYSIFSCVMLRQLTYINSRERMQYQVFISSAGTLHKFDKGPASTTDYTTYNKAGWAAFVVTAFGEILVNTREDFIFNHASFVSGGPVLFSGELRIDKRGYIVGITNLSGHYLPQLDNLRHLCNWFNSVSVNLSKCVFYIYNKAKDLKFEENVTFADNVDPDQYNLNMLNVCHSVVDVRHLNESVNPYSQMNLALNRLIRYLKNLLNNENLVCDELRFSLEKLKEQCEKALFVKSLRNMIALISTPVNAVVLTKISAVNFLTEKIKSDMNEILEHINLIDFIEVLPDFVSPREPFLYCENQLQACSRQLLAVIEKYFGEDLVPVIMKMPTPSGNAPYDLEFFSAFVGEAEQRLLPHNKDSFLIFRNNYHLLSDNCLLRDLALKVYQSMSEARFVDFKNEVLLILEQMKFFCNFNFQEKLFSVHQNPITENFRQCLLYACWDYYLSKAAEKLQEKEFRIIKNLLAILLLDFESLESFVGEVHRFLMNENNKLPDLMWHINKKLHQGFSKITYKNFEDLRNVSEDIFFAYLANKILNPYRYTLDCFASFLVMADGGTFIQKKSEERGKQLVDQQRFVANTMRSYMRNYPGDSTAPAFIVHAGDNFYKLGVPNPDDSRFQEFKEIYKNLPPIFLVMGNHDHRRLKWDKVAFFKSVIQGRTPALSQEQSSRVEKVKQNGLLDEYKVALGTPRKLISANQVEHTMRLKPIAQGDQLTGRAFYTRAAIDLNYLERNNWCFNMPNLFYSVNTKDALLIFLDSNIFVKDFLKYMLKNKYIRKNSARSNPIAYNRVDNQVAWLIKFLEDHKDDPKPKILIWHHPLHPYSKRFKNTDTDDFLQTRHKQMLQSIGCGKESYHEILGYVLIQIRNQLKIPENFPLFKAIFSGHEHINSVVYKPLDSIAPLHCTFGTAGAGLHKRERFESNAFFNTDHAFAHVQIVEGVVHVKLQSIKGTSWIFSNQRGLVINELPGADINKFRKTILNACEKCTKKLVEYRDNHDLLRMTYNSIDIVKQWCAIELPETINFVTWIKELLTLPRPERKNEFLFLLAVINDELTQKMFDDAERRMLARQSNNIDLFVLYDRISDRLIAKHQQRLSRQSNDDIAIQLHDAEGSISDVSSVADRLSRDRLSRSK